MCYEQATWTTWFHLDENFPSKSWKINTKAKLSSFLDSSDSIFCKDQDLQENLSHADTTLCTSKCSWCVMSLLRHLIIHTVNLTLSYYVLHRYIFSCNLCASVIFDVFFHIYLPLLHFGIF